jgi:methylthioribose-1-phosphate isomerase
MKVKSLERIGNKLRFIDQTSLPAHLTSKETSDYRAVIDAIKKLEIRGAPAIGIAAAYGLALALQEKAEYSFGQFEIWAGEFKASRPTAVNLFWAVDRVESTVKGLHNAPYQVLLDTVWREAEEIHDEDRKMCERIGAHGAELVRDGASILTHCNTGALATGGIGTALGVIYTCRDQGKKIKVYADETRPLLQGARLTAWELQQEGIDVTLICDSVAGMLMRQKKIDLAIVGADRIARNGDFANKIGTYSVAVLAKEHGIPFYVAAPESTFDRTMADGSSIVIEERSPREVIEGFGKLTAPPDIKVYSPAFDVTPGELVTAFITDRGISSGGRGL